MEEEVKYLDYEGLILYHQNLQNALDQKVNSSDLADVATSGNYNDLTNTPTNVSTFNNDAGYITNEIDNTNGHDFVEIGGLKWATMNIGANNITDKGLYFQWGDNEGYSAEEVGVNKQFTWEDYKFNPSGDGVTFTKYNSTDQKVSLDLEDDPVALLWGSDWRTPTYAELQVLRESVDVSWTDDYEDSGIPGLILTDKTDSEKVLFFPTTGLCNSGSIISENEGFYWSKSLLQNTESSGIGIGFNNEDTSWNLNYPRYYGYCVRGILNGPAKRTIMGVTQSEKDIWNSKIDNNDLQVALDEYGNVIYYDSTTQKIQLKHGNTVLSEFSAAPFIKDGMVSNVEIKDVTIDEELVKCLVITFNTDSQKQTINIPISDIFNPDNYYTKTQIDSNYYNKSEIDDIVEEIEEETAQLENYYTKEEVDGIIYVPTISTPTSSTLTYTRNGKQYNFKIGQLARVADSEAPLGYKFYQLFDIDNGEAKWSVCATKITPSYIPPTPLEPVIYTGSPQSILVGGSSGDGNIQYSLDGENWSTTIPQVTNTGTYTVYWRLQGDGIHSDVPPTAITVTMLPKEVENPGIILSIDTYTYDGNACTPTVTLKDGDTTIDSSEYTVTYSNNTNAGTATITITNVANSNYIINTSTTFTINKANGSVITAPVNRASTYNGSAQPVADAGSGTGTMMYRLGDSGDFSSSMLTTTNAGTYTLYYYAAESTNYLQSSTSSIEVTIVKAVPTYSSPSAKTPTYNGDAQDLLNAGSTNDGTIQYLNDGGTTWSTTIPQGTNAGSYTPQWRLVGDSNHNDLAATTINVSITKANPTYTAPTAKTLTYNSNAQDLVNAGSSSDGTISYSEDEETWGSTVPSKTNAGDYTVYWKLDGDANHNDITSTAINVSIAKVTPTVVAPTAKSLIYNAQAQELVNAGSTNWGTLQYSLNDIDYSTTIPSGTNAGDYSVYYRVVGDSNINDVAVISVSVSVAKVTPTVSAPTAKTGLIYDGTEQTFINVGSTNFGTLQYSLDGETYSTTIPSGTNAGNYNIYYRVVGDGNINDVAIQSITTSIAKVIPTVTAPTPKVLTFNGSAQALANAGSTDFGTMQYKVGIDSWSTSIPERTKGGSYELLYRVVGDSNINDVATDSITCSITEKEITATVELSENSYVYDGTAKTPSVTVKDGTTVIDPSEYSVTYSNNTNAGTATVTVYDNEGGDYKVIGSATFAITKASGSVTAPTAKTLTYNGAAQTLANAGSGTGTMYYSLSEGSGFSTSIPQGTNAGSYTVYYYAAESANYNQSATGSISVSIGKANGNVTSAPTAKSLTYSGSAQTLANAGSGTGTMYYSLNASSGFSTTIPTGTNATSYTVYYYAAESDNYNQSATSSISVSIAKADTSYTAPTAKSLTYSGSGQELLNAGSVMGGTIQYSADNSTWSTTIPSQTNAGTYTSYWKIVGDSNHNDKASASISTTIAKANQSAPTATGATTTYNTTATATASGGGGQGSIEWSNGNTQTSVGSKTTKARWAGNANYNASGWSNEVTLTMNKASQNAPTATGATVNLGSTATASASGGGGQGSLEWSNGNTRTALGSQTTKARWSGNSNYNASAWSNEVTLEVKETRVVAKFNVTSTSSPTQIIGSYSSSPFSAIEIDGVEQPSVVSSYTFSTTGEHTVKYTLTDPTSISYSAFEQCSGLTSVAIPNSVTSIGNSAFRSCSSLTSITIPNSVTSIDVQAFAVSGLTSITIPSSVTSIKSQTFIQCSNLTSVTIPSSVTSIASMVFYRCSNLTNITCYATTAPTIQGNPFQNVSTGGTLRVPRGSTGYDVWMNKLDNWTKVEQ